MGEGITKTIVVNLGSKARENEETPVSFDNAFEVDEWEDVEEYALSVLNNSEDKLHKDEQKPAAIPTKNPSVTAGDDTKPAATPKEEMYKDEQKLVAIPTKTHQSQLRMIRNLRLLYKRRRFLLSKNRQSYSKPFLPYPHLAAI
jgi:hypothetical protein